MLRSLGAAGTWSRLTLRKGQSVRGAAVKGLSRQIRPNMKGEGKKRRLVEHPRRQIAVVARSAGKRKLLRAPSWNKMDLNKEIGSSRAKENKLSHHVHTPTSLQRNNSDHAGEMGKRPTWDRRVVSSIRQREKQDRTVSLEWLN